MAVNGLSDGYLGLIMIAKETQLHAGGLEGWIDDAVDSFEILKRPSRPAEKKGPEVVKFTMLRAHDLKAANNLPLNTRDDEIGG